MKILRDFMEAFPASVLTPCQERLLRQSAEEDVLDTHEQAAADISGGRLAVYFASNTEERIDLTGLWDGKVYGGWFNPSDGSVDLLGELSEACSGILHIKNSSEDGPDRVLILASAPKGCSVPSLTFGDEKNTREIKKVFEW